MCRAPRVIASRMRVDARSGHVADRATSLHDQSRADSTGGERPDQVDCAWRSRSRASSPSEPPRTPTSSWTSSRAPIRRPRSAVLADLAERETTMGATNLVVGVRPEVWARVSPGTLPEGSPASRRTWSEPTASRCPPPSTTWRSGSRRRRTTWSSTRRWTPWGSWRHTPRWPASSGLGLSPGPRPHRLRGRHREPDPRERARLRPGPGRLPRRRRRGVAAPAVGTRLASLVRPGRLGPGRRDRPHQARQHRARPQARDLARGPHRPGRLRPRARRNTAYGTVSDHGTVFVGFASSKAPLHTMLESMAGVDGPRDALTRYTTR